MLRTLIKYYYYYKAGRECGGAVRESVCVERLEFVGVVRVGVESESCWSDWSRFGVESCWSRVVEIVVILVSSERAKKADDSCISECASGVRRNSIIVL